MPHKTTRKPVSRIVPVTKSHAALHVAARTQESAAHAVESAANLLLVPSVRTAAFKALPDVAHYHPLDVETCVHPRRLPKLVERDHYTFLSVAAARYDARIGQLSFEPLELFIGKARVVVVGDQSLEPLSAARTRTASLRASSAFRITYLVLDEILDAYLVALDAIGESVETMEAKVLTDPSTAILQHIFKEKRTLIDFRRNAAGMREVVNAMLRNPAIAQDPDLATHYRDLYDHAVQTIEFIETYRDLLSGSLDIYLSAVANRTNEVMKVLTVYSTVALPLIVVTGFYGMNIKLPMQDWPHSVFFVATGMFVFAGAMLWSFKKKNWF